MNFTPSLHTPTSRHRSTVARSLLAVAGALLTHAAFAQAPAAPKDDGERTYRCVVLGQRDACEARDQATNAAPQIESRLELGPLTQYQIHLGMDREQAIAYGRERGEEPAWQQVRVTRPVLSAQALYERVVNGNPPASTVETLSREAAAPGTDASARIAVE